MRAQPISRVAHRNETRTKERGGARDHLEAEEDDHVPVCLIWGKNDIITPPEVAEEFLAGFPDADLHWIDECGHAPMMEHPDTFNQILSDWFASRGIS